MTLDVSLGRAVLELTTDPTKLRATMSAAKSEAVSTLRSAQTSLASVGAQMDRTGQQLTLGVTLPVLAAGKAIIDTGMDFETTLGQIVGLTDVTQDQIGGIKDRVLELGGEVGKAPQELAEAFYFVASAGFEAEEAMTLLDTAAHASASGLGTTQDVAKVLGLTLNAYGHENISAARAADILTAAVKDGTAEADAFAGVLGRVVPTAATMGVSFDQVTAALAAMTLTGLSADEAATSLNQVMTSLLKPTREAEDAMADMGLTSQGLRDQLREQGLLATLRTLEERFEGNDEAASKVFGNVRALRGVLSLLTLDSDKLNDVFGDTLAAQGDLAEGYDATETSARAMARSQAELDAALIDLSEDVLPVAVDALHDMVGFIKGVVETFKSLPPGVRESIVRFLGLAAALGPVLLIGGKLVSALAGLWGGLDKIAVVLVGKVAPALVSTNLAGGPVLLLLIALADLVDKAPKLWDAWGDAIDAVGRDDLPAASAALRDFADAIPAWLPGAFLMKEALKQTTTELDATAAAAAAAQREQAAFADGSYDAVEALRGVTTLPAQGQYEKLAGVVRTWADQSVADHAKVLNDQRTYTAEALRILQSFRTEIEGTYSAAQQAALDFERTTVAISTKQAELTALDKDYVDHKGEMTKLEVAQYKLRRREIIAELNGLKLHAALIGDEMEQTTALTSLLTSREMKEGLTSDMPETQAAYRALRDDVLAKLGAIESRGGPASQAAARAIAKFMNPNNPVSPLYNAGRWGWATGREWITNLRDAIGSGIYGSGGVYQSVQKVALILKATSPPGPASPLHEIDAWGARTGEAWLAPMLSVLDGAATRIREPLERVRSALTTPYGMPSLDLAVAGAGIGGFDRRTIPNLPDAASDVARDAVSRTPEVHLHMYDARNRDPLEVLDRAARLQRFGAFDPDKRTEVG